MNNLKLAEQTRRTLQMYAQTLKPEEAIEVSTLFPKWEANRFYKSGEMFAYGENAVEDPQLYRVRAAHTSTVELPPDTTPELYEVLGLSDGGYPVWSRPSGLEDAYGVGDIVDYNGTLYISTIDENVYSPEEDTVGWQVYTETE